MEELNSNLPSSLEDDFNCPAGSRLENLSDTEAKETQTRVDEETGRKVSEEFELNRRSEEVQDERTDEGEPSPVCNEKSEISVLETESYRYTGEVLEDQRNGFGICEYKCGDVFIGYFKNDLREGYGKLIYANGDEIIGETKDDFFKGYCEFFDKNNQITTKGFFDRNEFETIVVMVSMSKVFEGEKIVDKMVSPISIGKIYSEKKPQKFFLGEVNNYSLECGYGVWFVKNSSLYYGKKKNNHFEGYIEMYVTDGSAYSGFLEDGLKQGFGFSISRDARCTFGWHEKDHRVGPFIQLSNAKNLSKPSGRLDMYHLGFRTRTVDKIEHAKKYLNLYYPEYSDIFKVNYEQIFKDLYAKSREETGYIKQLIGSRKEK